MKSIYKCRSMAMTCYPVSVGSFIQTTNHAMVLMTRDTRLFCGSRDGQLFCQNGALRLGMIDCLMDVAGQGM